MFDSVWDILAHMTECIGVRLSTVVVVEFVEPVLTRQSNLGPGYMPWLGSVSLEASRNVLSV